MMRSVAALATFASLAPLVLGHGQIDHITADEQTNQGPNQYYDADAKNKNTAVRVQYKASSPSYVLPGGFSDPGQMSCEGSASSGAPTTIKIKAGDTLSIFWAGATSELLNKPGTGGLTAYNPWVHAMGPIQDYITSCNGDCSSFDATNAGWTKLAGMGIDGSQAISDDLRTTMKNKPEEYHPTSGNGLWAMAKFVQDGSKWDVAIPKALKNGQYIVRNEMAAVHNPKNSDPTTGPQLYIGCVQVEVTDGGSSDLPAGTKSSDLYDANGDFANFNVYSGNPLDFKLPGPAVWDQSSSSSSSANTGSQLADTGSSSSNSNSGSSGTSSAPTSASSGKCKKRSVKRSVDADVKANARRTAKLHRNRLH